jgi:hypothetical protein
MSVRIGQFNVSEEVLEPYVKHVIDRWIGKIGPLPGQEHSSYELETERERLHNVLLDTIGLSKAQYPIYQEFDRALERYIDDKLPPREDIKVHKLNKPRRINNDI